MSAGSGVRHSEFNASKVDPVHFLQIWIQPAKLGIAPGYEQKTFTREDKQGRLRLVASPDGRDGTVTVHADALLYAGLFDAGQAADVTIGAGRSAWVHVARGKAKVNGRELGEGGAAAITDETKVSVEGVDGAEVLVFDLA